MEIAEHRCRKCEKVFSLKEYLSTLFCSSCGAHIPSQPQPKHWLFQFNPKIYDWFGRQKECTDNEQWLTSQNSKVIRKDDLVAICSSGPNSPGIYALGCVLTNPAKKPLNALQEKYFKNRNFIEKFRENSSVEVNYLRTLIDKPLLQDECNHDPHLLDMQVFMNPHGTNFCLSNTQFNRIKELLEQKN